MSKKKKAGDNWLLNAVRKHQSNPSNKSPSSKFVKRQLKLQKMLEEGYGN